MYFLLKLSNDVILDYNIIITVYEYIRVYIFVTFNKFHSNSHYYSNVQKKKTPLIFVTHIFPLFINNISRYIKYLLITF